LAINCVTGVGQVGAVFFCLNYYRRLLQAQCR